MDVHAFEDGVERGNASLNRGGCAGRGVVGVLCVDRQPLQNALLELEHGLRVLELRQVLVVVGRVRSLRQRLLLSACRVLCLKVGQPRRGLLVRDIAQRAVGCGCRLEPLQSERGAELVGRFLVCLLGLERLRLLLRLRHLLRVAELPGLLVGLLRGQALLLLVVELLHRVVVRGVVTRAYKLVLRKLIVQLRLRVHDRRACPAERTGLRQLGLVLRLLRPLLLVHQIHLGFQGRCQIGVHQLLSSRRIKLLRGHGRVLIRAWCRVGVGEVDGREFLIGRSLGDIRQVVGGRRHPGGQRKVAQPRIGLLLKRRGSGSQLARVLRHGRVRQRLCVAQHVGDIALGVWRDCVLN